MAFATPWKPTLNGNDLGPCSIIQELVEGRVVPNPRKEGHLDWTWAGYKKEVEKVPEAKAALSECVTAIWRLQSAEKEGSHDKDWVNHLVAWLVRPPSPLAVSVLVLTEPSKMRHRELVEAAGIPPLNVVVRYSDYIRQKALVPTAWIPTFSTNPQTADASPITATRPTPKVNKIVAGAEDVSMEDFEGSQMKATKVQPETVPSSASKRELQASPSRVEVTTKRSRLGKQKAPAIGQTHSLEDGDDAGVDSRDVRVVKDAVGVPRSRISSLLKRMNSR